MYIITKTTITKFEVIFICIIFNFYELLSLYEGPNLCWKFQYVNHPVPDIIKMLMSIHDSFEILHLIHLDERVEMCVDENL